MTKLPIVTLLVSSLFACSGGHRHEAEPAPAPPSQFEYQQSASQYAAEEQIQLASLGGGGRTQSVELASDDSENVAFSGANLVGQAVGAVAGAVSESTSGPAPEPSRIRSQVKKGPMMLVEANVGLEVETLDEAAASVRALTQRLGGRVVGDEVLAESARATFVLRIPPGGVSDFFEAISEIGYLTHRRVSATDVSKRFVDNQIQLDNLYKALARYQEILSKANTVQEMLAVEQQLTRVKGQIEKIKGELKYLHDKVALATITLTLRLRDQEVQFAPRAKFHPGARYGYLAVSQKGKAARGFYGPGFSLHVKRWMTLDIDMLSDRDNDPWRADAILVSLGAAVYSDFLGRGKRTWLNPYFGYAMGYSRVDETDAFSIGGSLGLELFKSEHVLIDANLRAVGMFGEGDPRLGTQGTLGVNVAF